MTFEFLGLSEKLLDALISSGYATPTPIQKAVIPAILMGRDVLGIAQTGTGKTAGFTLPMIDILAEGTTKARMPRSLILEPTRELAVQIQESFRKYGQNHKLTTALLIGGTSMDDQVTNLDSGVDVLIATPGRLLDHFERGNVMLNGIEILVIDESDRMLDMGFIPDVERIRKLITKKPQTLFFSATMPPEIKKLTEAFLTDPKVIQVSPPTSTAETVLQNYVSVGPRDKLAVLEKILRNPEVTSALIFCNRKLDVTAVYRALRKAGLDISELHGDMAQSSRLEVLYAFKAGDLRYLVASDVAARGLDIPDVSHVVNYDMPQNVEDYIHRIGRTGRAGRAGHAILLVASRDREMLGKIEGATKVKITPLGGAAAAHREDAKPAEASPEPRHDQPRQQPFQQDGERFGPRRHRGGRGRGGRNRHQGRGHHDQGRPQQPHAQSTAQPQSQPHHPAQAHQPRPETKPQPEQRPQQDQPKPQPLPQQHQPRPQPQPHSQPRRDHRDRDDDNAPATFGDNVPAFLRASTFGRK